MTNFRVVVSKELKRQLELGFAFYRLKHPDASFKNFMSALISEEEDGKDANDNAVVQIRIRVQQYGK